MVSALATRALVAVLAAIVVISMPSMLRSYSALRTSPSLAPEGTIEMLRTPLGSRAPAARQDHWSSPRRLVNWMSMLLAMGGQIYPSAACCRFDAVAPPFLEGECPRICRDLTGESKLFERSHGGR